jgi:serine/threonine protein kinase
MAMPCNTPHFSQRILREIKLLRHFKQHENIVAVKDLITYPPNTEDFRVRRRTPVSHAASPSRTVVTT